MFTPTSTDLRNRRGAAAAVLFSVLAVVAGRAQSEQPGLLFHLSGDYSTIAEIAAGGTSAPRFSNGVLAIGSGAMGGALQCADDQLLAYEAAGNIYAQRGTLSFFWRSRYPVGPTEFPIFRVSYADHSSWDMVWLRIDYNGHGFDAFVTDANLARTRVSITLDPFPGPQMWTHLALAWDETRGIRFYVNGRLAARNEMQARYDAGLDQFGPHSRIISPYQVQSDYNFVRGGDIDEVRIYDRMLDDPAVAVLARGELPASLIPWRARDLADLHWRDEWRFRFGWNRPDDPPPLLDAAVTAVRKVEIHDAFDLERWWWKANDGIRETTWPGVYNRSRLPGRHDYFVLPDWDCYSESGKAVAFTMPDEPWNHLEISGAAWGTLTATTGNTGAISRAEGQERTWHRLREPIRGGAIRFENAEPETPIGELAAYHVAAGEEPAGIGKLSYRLSTGGAANPALESLVAFINGRHPSDERAIMVALPRAVAPARRSREVSAADPRTKSLPLVHVLIPHDFREAARQGRAASYTWDSINAGLDGIALVLPALEIAPTHGDRIALNIQVKDPLWPARNMLDFSFSVKRGEVRTLWLDLRDRILPAGKSLYLAIASASPDFGVAALEGAELRLVFKPRAEAVAEHVLDRFTQARDNYAMLVEERPNDRRFKLYARFEADITDLLRVEPDHDPGRNYWCLMNPEQPTPGFVHPEAPAEVPLWAFRQTEMLRRLHRFVAWYIDHRQIESGELGGGLSDDTDLTNHWPATALMGCEPERVAGSLRRVLEACYAQGMFTNGLPTIQTDELHTYEEGINALAQVLMLDHGDPRQLERAMETMRGVAGITGVNSVDHRHFRSSYYGGTKVATEDPWGWSKTYSHLVLHPGYLLVEYNGAPAVRTLITEIADGLLAHRHVDASGRALLPTAIHFASDREGTYARGGVLWEPFWAAWKWTGRAEFLLPINDGGPSSLLRINANALDLLQRRGDWGAAMVQSVQRATGRGSTASRYTVHGDRHIAWQMTSEKQLLAAMYEEQIEAAELLEFVNTEGSLWIDRVGVPYAELQRARLGGVALVRNAIFPGHAVSWRFATPATGESVAILIPDATPSAFTVIVFNLEDRPVRAMMTGWNVDPGQWEIVQGVDRDGDDAIDQASTTRTATFGRAEELEFTYPALRTSVLKLRLQSAGTPHWQRPDVGIARDDVVVSDGGRRMQVTVHSLGAVDAPAGRVVLRGRDGREIAAAAFPAIDAPTDLFPKKFTVALDLPAGSDASGGTIAVECAGDVEEITRRNNALQL